LRRHLLPGQHLGSGGLQARVTAAAALLANLALSGSALLQTLADQLHEQSLPELRDNLRSRPKRCVALIAKL
jgi:hypothetical protein